MFAPWQEHLRIEGLAAMSLRLLHPEPQTAVVEGRVHVDDPLGAVDPITAAHRRAEAAIAMREHARRKAKREGDALRHLAKARVLGGLMRHGRDLDGLLARDVAGGVDRVDADIADRPAPEVRAQADVRSGRVLAVAG